MVKSSLHLLKPITVSSISKYLSHAKLAFGEKYVVCHYSKLLNQCISTLFTEFNKWF